VLSPLAPADAPVTDLLRLRAAAGVDLGDVDRLAPRTRRAVRVAGEVGAPLLTALDGAAAAERDRDRARRAVAVASAQTRTVAGGLLVAPLLLVPALGRLVGADLVGFYTIPIGVAVGLVGIVLLATGAAIVAGLVRRVGRPPRRRAASHLALAVPVAVVVAVAVHWTLALVVVVVLLRRRAADASLGDVDEVADLVATALAGGVAAGAALRLAADELPAHAVPLRRVALDLELDLDGHAIADLDPGLARVREVVATATAVGAPAAPALRRLAADLRAEELAHVLAAAERLPAHLTFPTALCLLPATLLLVGAPMVHAGLAAAAT
jgi:hypothetical protein